MRKNLTTTSSDAMTVCINWVFMVPHKKPSLWARMRGWFWCWWPFQATESEDEKEAMEGMMRLSEEALEGEW